MQVTRLCFPGTNFLALALALPRGAVLYSSTAAALELYLSFRAISANFLLISTLDPSACSIGDQPGADLGPLITPQAKERVCRLIDSGTKEGASILLDGRKIKVKGYENGNFVGPTIISNVKVNNSGLFHKCQS